MIPKTIRLANGVEMPKLGLGVWQAAAGTEAREAVAYALEVGYRHIDTAAMYGNEADVGEAVRASGLKRSEIFVTTKLWNSDQGYEPALKAFSASMARLKLDYLDLYLVHWPVPGLRLESWRALEKLHSEGLVRSIGVSNYMVRHLEELTAQSDIAPVVNQIELHPFLQHSDVRQYCAEHSIVIQAYSPLTRGQRINHPFIRGIADQIGRTPAQVLLRWGLEKNLVVLPKSIKRERIVENSQIFDFELGKAEMEQLDRLDEGTAIGWDPRRIP